MLDYSYPLYFLNWKSGRSGRGGGEGVERGLGPPFFALSFACSTNENIDVANAISFSRFS